MSKHTAPAVRVRDVFAALPAVPSPLGWQVYVQPLRSTHDRAHCVVALVMHAPKGLTFTVKRWGQEASANSDGAHVSAWLLAAQQAWMWLEGVDVEELVALALWEVAARA